MGWCIICCFVGGAGFFVFVFLSERGDGNVAMEYILRSLITTILIFQIAIQAKVHCII